jgi:hypothetical protein
LGGLLRNDSQQIRRQKFQEVTDPEFQMVEELHDIDRQSLMGTENGEQRIKIIYLFRIMAGCGAD